MPRLIFLRHGARPKKRDALTPTGEAQARAVGPLLQAHALRPDLATVETHPFLLWGLRLNYALDPPVNLFPSLHLAGATLASLAVGKARASYGRIAGILVVPIALSVCAVKQHYWIDAAAGIALGFGVYAVLLARWSPPAGETLARPPRAWLGFAGLLATVYLALYLAYRAGFEPFPG